MLIYYTETTTHTERRESDRRVWNVLLTALVVSVEILIFRYRYAQVQLRCTSHCGRRFFLYIYFPLLT